MARRKLPNRFAKVAARATLPLVSLALAAGALKADTLTWSGSGGGNWSAAANWSSDGSHTVPQPGDTIKINTLKSGETYNNDIVGLSTPHLEFGGQSDPTYPKLTGNPITLTGGMNAFSTSSGRFANYIPLVLTVQDGNPTNRFYNHGGRLTQYGKVTGAGLLFKDGKSIMDIYGGNEHTGGTVNGGTLSGWLDPYAIASGDNAGGTPCGSLSSTYTISGKTLSRFSINTFPHNTDIRPASDKGATATDFWFYSGIKSFTGNITGTRLVVDLDNGTSPTFSGSITLDTGLRFTFTKASATSKHSATISGTVSCSALNDYVNAPSTLPVSANLYLTHADNSIGAIYANVWNLHAGAKNAFGNSAVVYLGKRADGFGMFDLGGYDQCIDRFIEDSRYPADGTVADMVGHVVASASSARLTMAATDDCTTDAQFDGGLTLAWNPRGAYSFSTALPGRAMPMTGGLVVSNGTFIVNGTNSFERASYIEVADGATFNWASAKAFGLRSASSLKIGDGAAFSVSPSAAFPFVTNMYHCGLSLDLAPGASLSLPSGTVLPALAVTTGGVAFAAGTTLSGSSGEEGTVYLPQLGAGVKVKVVDAVAQVTTLSTRAYVQDGLLCHLDGIDNAGRGVHDPAALTWKDLSGVAGDFEVANNANYVAWTANGLHKKGNHWMALNRAQVGNVKTCEAAMSNLGFASADTVMPFYHSAERYFVIRDSSSSRKIWYRNGNCYGIESMPDAATISVTYGSAYSIYQNGTVPEGASGESGSWSSNNDPTGSMSIGGRAITWASADVSTYGYDVNAIRMYNRVLTADEVRQNYEVDSIRFRGVVPEGAVNYRVDPVDESMVDCRLSLAMVGGGISVDGAEGVASATLWPMLGDFVVLSAECDAQHDFVGWVGDTNAIVNGTAESSVVTVRVDRALSFNAVTRAGVLVVTEDTHLAESIACRGIRFTGPWTLSAAVGASVQVEEFGEDITVDEGTSGTAAISCPLVVGVLSAGDEQRIAVPSGATLEISGPFDGIAPLRVSGAGALKLTGGGSYSGAMAVDMPKLFLKGTFSSMDGSVTFSTTSAVELAEADVGMLLRVSAVKGAVLTCAAGTTNYLRSGWNQFTQSTTSQVSFDVLDDAELTIEKSFNGAGVNGIYPNLRGKGTIHMRTGSDNLGCLNAQISNIHVWKPMYAVNRSYYNRLQSTARMSLHAENALTKAPWQVNGYLDLCGLDQTMGRFSYASEGSGSSWKCYATGEIHSDAPATLTVYHDDNASGGGNHGPQVFGGKFTGAASLVKTGTGTELAMSTNHLILAGANTSTGSVAVTWGLLSFTNSFTLGTTQYLGTWPGCASATASGNGVLELCHSKALGRWTDVYVGVGGKVRLKSGVNQRVRYLYLPTGENGEYVRQRIGTYGSSQSAAPAGNQLDAYFEGPGTLTSAGEFDGTAFIFK